MNTLNSQSNILVNNGSGKHLQQHHYKNPDFANTYANYGIYMRYIFAHSLLKILRTIFVYLRRYIVNCD